jgi:hypothetical protein
VGVGVCTILANQAGNSQYAAAEQVTQSLTVEQGSQTLAWTVSASAGGNQKAGEIVTVVAVSSAGVVPVTYSASPSGVCTASGAEISFVAAGSCTIFADQAGSASYAAAAQIMESLTVLKGE